MIFKQLKGRDADGVGQEFTYIPVNDGALVVNSRKRLFCKELRKIFVLFEGKAKAKEPDHDVRVGPPPGSPVQIGGRKKVWVIGCLANYIHMFAWL